MDHQVVTVDDDTDIDELIEMDDSDRDHSDNDLFMSPPPLSLSQDHVAETASKQPTQTGKQLCSRAKDIGSFEYTVKPVLVATSIKQATCI